LILIDELNADIKDTAVYAPNKFADMTPAEFKNKMLMNGKAGSKIGNKVTRISEN
jgi:hypothetical protein